jgi:ATP/maltotriose-dependent transcriptional regulator MalT
MDLEPADVTQALAHLELAKRDLRDTGATAADISHGDVLLARAFLLGGRPAEALEAADRALASTPGEVSLTLAEASLARSEALAVLARDDDALVALRETAELLGKMDARDRWVAQVWCEVAEMFEGLGDVKAAHAALKSAASASGLRVRERAPIRESAGTLD